jgi:5-methyltetrahydrofolate--homocysteine methyltransferase
MTELGRLLEDGERFLPEMLMDAREILRPQLVEGEVEAMGKVVSSTVAGDLHDSGKNLLGMMLEGAGFEIIDLGTDVKPEQFAAAVQEHEPDLVGMSALLATTMASISKTIEALTEAGVRD